MSEYKTSMAISEHAPILHGTFAMHVLNKYGEIVDIYRDDNMIVNGARKAMAMLVAEGVDTGKVITRFGVGIGTDIATPADTELTGCYVKDIIGHDFPEHGTVRFFWNLGYDESNDKNISEFALFCADGTMFSRKVRSPIYKASDIAFEGEWSIIF